MGVYIYPKSNTRVGRGASSCFLRAQSSFADARGRSHPRYIVEVELKRLFLFIELHTAKLSALFLTPFPQPWPQLTTHPCAQLIHVL